MTEQERIDLYTSIVPNRRQLRIQSVKRGCKKTKVFLQPRVGDRKKCAEETSRILLHMTMISGVFGRLFLSKPKIHLM